MLHVNFKEDGNVNMDGGIEKINALFNLVFRLKDDTDGNSPISPNYLNATNAIQRHPSSFSSVMSNAKHPLANLTAFEIAVAKGDNASIKCFNEVFKDI